MTKGRKWRKQRAEMIRKGLLTKPKPASMSPERRAAYEGAQRMIKKGNRRTEDD